MLRITGADGVKEFIAAELGLRRPCKSLQGNVSDGANR